MLRIRAAEIASGCTRQRSHLPPESLSRLDARTRDAWAPMATSTATAERRGSSASDMGTPSSAAAAAAECRCSSAIDMGTSSSAAAGAAELSPAPAAGVERTCGVAVDRNSTHTDCCTRPLQGYPLHAASSIGGSRQSVRSSGGIAVHESESQLSTSATVAAQSFGGTANVATPSVEPSGILSHVGSRPTAPYLTDVPLGTTPDAVAAAVLVDRLDGCRSNGDAADVLSPLVGCGPPSPHCRLGGSGSMSAWIWQQLPFAHKKRD